jgi:hypothetical protein
MNIREISDIFKDTADNITAIKSYNFGWASDRVRQGNTEDFQELNEFPRVFFAVPTITGSDQTRKQDTYQVTLFFDDLLGYDNEGDADLTLQIDKWANLQQYANYFVQRLNKIKQSILPNYLFIPEAPSITFDSFTGLQRMITVQLSFNLVVPTNCDPGIITLVQCIANIVTSSNLTASLTTVLKFAASLEARATVTADINFVQKAQANLSALASLSGDINFVQKAQASLLTSANVTGNITIPKTFNASLLATGTTTANLTVNAPSAGLLLDLYPNAAAAYSLRKLRTAYTGSAVRVRRSSDNTEQNIGFVAGELDTASLLAFCGFGNGFVTTWYDQSGNARNATQSSAINQPQIVSSGVVILESSKPALNFDGVNSNLLNNTISITQPITRFTVGKSINTDKAGVFMDSNTFTDRFVLIKGFPAENPGKFIAQYSATAGVLAIDFNSNRNLFYELANNGSNAFSINNNTEITGNNGTGSLIGLRIGRLRIEFYPAGYQLSGNIQEIIIYPSNQSGNKTGIQSNINGYYAIY